MCKLQETTWANLGWGKGIEDRAGWDEAGNEEWSVMVASDLLVLCMGFAQI